MEVTGLENEDILTSVSKGYSMKTQCTEQQQELTFLAVFASEADFADTVVVSLPVTPATATVSTGFQYTGVLHCRQEGGHS